MLNHNKQTNLIRVRTHYNILKTIRKKKHKNIKTNLIGEVPFQFPDGLAPVLTQFLGYQLDIQEGTLPGSETVPASGAPDYPGRHVGDVVLLALATVGC